MIGRMSQSSKRTMKKARVVSEGTMESEVSPQLPTSGQILGTLARSMGLRDPRLSSKSAQRYFSGRMKDLVTESKRSTIVQAISESLVELGFETPPKSEEATSASVLASFLDWHAVHWDNMRTFLLPRMHRVYPSHLATVWQAYLRLAIIDLALRVAAYLQLRGESDAALDFLDWISVSRRGSYLNQKRKDAGVSPIGDFAELVGVHENTAENWVYQGARPSDENLMKIGRALTPNGDPYGFELMVRDLRRLYWISELAETLGKYVGAEAVEDMAVRLRRYASWACLALDDSSSAKPRPSDLEELATLGAYSSLAQPLLEALAKNEADEEWKDDLNSASSDWVRRVLGVNLQVHRAEMDALIKDTGGRILEDWDIGDPRAFEHYQRSMELQLQGKMDEAIAEVEKASELDPLDPANYFTLGSYKGHLGVRNGDGELVREGLEACWIAVALDPNWIVPWTEIGWIQIEIGREREALEHLRAVSPKCGPLDSRYYAALGVALRELGDFTASLTAFESSLKLNPNDRTVAIAAAGAAVQAEDRIRFNRHRKVAHHLGDSDELDRHLELMEEVKRGFATVDTTGDHDREIAYLDAIIKSNPGNAPAFIARGRAHFLKGEDSRAISDLNSAIRLEPSHSPAHLLRGIVYFYMKRYDRVATDMSEAIRLGSGTLNAYYYRGIAHGEQGALDLAITDLNEAIRLDPDHADAYRARGDCRRFKSEYDQAIGDFDRALRLDPESALSYRGRGAALRMMGEFDRAIADFNEALRLDSEDAFAYRFRGDAYLANGEYETAIADFDVTLSMNCTDDIAYRGRGNARLFGGELDLALADFDAAAKCNPESDLAIYGRGLVREVMGDIEGAERDYRRARELGYDDLG